MKLAIGRAKGKGRGNYRLFEIKKVDLEGHDFYGDPLEGIVVVKKGGTEDEGKTDYLERKLLARRAWAKAIIGALEVWPAEDPSRTGCSNTVSGIAKFLVGMWVNRNEDLDAAAFVGDWMDGIEEQEQMITVTGENQWKQVNDRLDKEFMQSADTKPVIVDEYTLRVEKKAGTKKTYHFVVGAAKDGVEE